MSGVLKAYAVQETDEGTGGIYFARHAIVARKAGAEEHGGGELSYVTCHRAPWADAFAGRPLPAKVMVAHGWYFECSTCGQRIDEDSLAERRLSVDGVIGTQHSLVFCNRKCCARHYSLARRRTAEEARAVAVFKDMVRARFPDADICEDESRFARHHAYVAHDRIGWYWLSVSVSFSFPGMTIAPALYTVKSGYGPRPPAARYECCAGDREAFEAYARATQPTSPEALPSTKGLAAASLTIVDPMKEGGR